MLNASVKQLQHIQGVVFSSSDVNFNCLNDTEAITDRWFNLLKVSN